MNQQSVDMKGKFCMVTGSNSGIGKATAFGLAKMGATVVMVCRDRSRGEAALAEIRRKSGSESVDLILADLSSQKSIHQLAGDFKSRYKQLHVLVNNAGVELSKRSATVDGIETTFAVNHLAPFLLTNLSLDVLKASAPSRVITVSSLAHEGETIDFDDLQGERHYGGFRIYGQSKLANILFTYELARKLEGTGVTANCLHPGVVRTSLGHDNGGVLYYVLKLISPFLLSPRRGAQTTLYLASSPEVANVTGKYFIRKKEARSSRESYDLETARKLWEVSEQLTNTHSLAHYD